jgi:hypothetical protein
MDAILLIIGIVYGVCRIAIKSVQQCTYFLFSVNLLITDKEPIHQFILQLFSGYFKEALATILTKKIICFGNW